MQRLDKVAEAFIEMAHTIVWASVATVDRRGRPRSRILHPYWEWRDASIRGWIATDATRTKREHLDASGHVSVNYWAPTHDTCVAECRAQWSFSDQDRRYLWDLFSSAPEPLGFDPAAIPHWGSRDSPGYDVLRLDPWRLRVYPGSVLLRQGGEVLTWEE